MECWIRKLVQEALSNLIGDEAANFSFQLSRPSNNKHGDLACNVALMLAKKLKRKPKDIAEELVNFIPMKDLISKIEVVDPGFINFFLSNKAYHNTLKQVLSIKEKYGTSNLGKGKSIYLEFVSVNPTGPLHVGHGRVAVYGSVLANCFEACGYKVRREYYVNDAGRQMDILTASVFIRYLEYLKAELSFPVAGYKGEYVKEIAKELHQQHGEQFFIESAKLLSGLPTDSFLDSDDVRAKDIYIDAIISKSKELLGSDQFRTIHEFTLNYEIKDIKEDLEALGIIQEWFSEQSLLDKNKVKKVIEILKAKNCVYKKDGALWFKSSDFGDEKDRVLVKANGYYTYFATDIAYHHHKFSQGFSNIVDVWGADHHGYIPRMNAALRALGHDDSTFHVLLVQFATLIQDKKKVQMSTRSGSFITLRELRKDVGVDATRLFYVSRKACQHMEFDINLAKSKSADNPIYYIQYAHARICSVREQLNEKGWTFDRNNGVENLNLLTSKHEQQLMRDLMKYPDVVEVSALNYEPYQLVNYLRELANHFHGYYAATIFLDERAKLRNARMCLVTAIRQILHNGLSLLGISAPEKM